MDHSELIGLVSRLKGLVGEIEATIASYDKSKLSREEYLKRPPDEREKLDKEEVMARGKDKEEEKEEEES